MFGGKKSEEKAVVFPVSWMAKADSMATQGDGVSRVNVVGD